MKEEFLENPILANLNPAQQEAVKVLEGPVLIVAGAGSGKTRVLTHKIAYLIDNGIPPQNILALTFTNKAAQVMKERIANLVSFEAAKQIWAGTFHSLFARILRAESSAIGYTSSFTIYDAEDSLSIIKRLIQANSASSHKLNPDAVQKVISLAKNKVLSPEDFAKTSSTPIERNIANIYKEYQNYLHQNNAMDFDDLLVNTYELFYSYKEILEKYQDRFLFILVDEYQDTNRVQYLVLKQLSSKFKNITVVGDDAQSIYRWRGADIRNILEFQKDFPDAKIIRLEQNYRSTKNILGAADSVIRFNRKQIEKKLWTNNLDGDLIELIVGETDKDEAHLVVSKIKELVSLNDFAYKDIAILYRTNAQSLEFENALRRLNIDYIVIGGMSFYRRKEIKDVLAYIRLLVNPNDNEAFIRIINEPPRGIGKTTLNHLINYARANNTSIYEAMKNVEKIDQIQSKAKAIISEFVKWLEITKEKMQIKNESHNALITFIDESGIIQMYEEIGTDDAYDRIDNIETLLSDIYDFLKENPDLGLEDYIQQISLLSDIDEKNLTDNQVKLMTLHSAKGMEFPVVFIVGLEQGLFPLVRNRSNQDDEEEERRLFYVGLTRAMEKVFLSYAKNRQRFGMDSYQFPSKFLSEIDRKYFKITMEESSLQSYNKDWQRDGYNISYGNEYDQTENGMLKKGDKVLHPFFGVGWVEKIEGSGNNIQALVLFESVGRKRLMLQYARLRKLTD